MKATIIRTNRMRIIFPVLVRYSISFNYSAEMQEITAFSALPVIRAILDEAGFLEHDYSLE